MPFGQAKTAIGKNITLHKADDIVLSLFDLLFFFYLCRLELYILANGYLMIKGFIIYIVLINILSGTLFLLDQQRSKKKHKKRISERTFHWLEAIGGVVGILLIMHGEGHKSKKKSYFIWTYIIFAAWLFGVFVVFSRLLR